MKILQYTCPVCKDFQVLWVEEFPPAEELLCRQCDRLAPYTMTLDSGVKTFTRAGDHAR